MVHACYMIIKCKGNVNAVMLTKFVMRLSSHTCANAYEWRFLKLINEANVCFHWTLQLHILVYFSRIEHWVDADSVYWWILANEYMLFCFILSIIQSVNSPNSYIHTSLKRICIRHRRPYQIWYVVAFSNTIPANDSSVLTAKVYIWIQNAKLIENSN